MNSKKIMSQNRFISSVLMISFTTAAVLFEWMFIAFFMALTIGGLYEFFYMIKKRESRFIVT